MQVLKILADLVLFRTENFITVQLFLLIELSILIARSPCPQPAVGRSGEREIDGFVLGVSNLNLRTASRFIKGRRYVNGWLYKGA